MDAAGALEVVDGKFPVLRNLEAYNLIVGIGFMGVGFVYATRWE